MPSVAAYLSIPTLTQMRAFVSADYQLSSLGGASTVGDQPERIYFFDPASLLPDDGNNVICPTINGATDPGRYIKLTIEVPSSVPTINNGTGRSLNSAMFKISAIKNSRVSYTIKMAFNATLVLTSTSIVTLQYTLDGGTTWISVSRVSTVINAGLLESGYNESVLHGDIPANAQVQILSTATNATNSISLSHEVIG